MAWSDRRKTLQNAGIKYGLVYFDIDQYTLKKSGVVFRSCDRLILTNENECCWMINHSDQATMNGIKQKVQRANRDCKIGLFELTEDLDVAIAKVKQ